MQRRTYAARSGEKVWESQLRKGSLTLAVLASLQYGSLCGSEIRSRLEQIAGLAVAEGVIYPILRRLRKMSFLESEWVEPEVGQLRRYFRLTSSGHRYLLELSRAWSKFACGMDRMLEASERETDGVGG